ncbi:MAG: heavy metal translocating P-type ATPase [Paracoccaceae bacterium]
MNQAARPAAPAVCPACMPLPDWARAVGDSAKVEAPLRRFEFALPGVHCAACITRVEDGLASLDGVAGARVNLTLKRVSLSAADVPGMQDMALQRLSALGYPAQPLDSAALAATQQDSEGRDLLARIAVSGFALMNVMLLSVSVWSGATDATRDLMHWISAVIALPATGFAAMPFFANATRALLARRLDMDVPISTAILLALGVSIWETAQSGAHAFFDAALMLTFFLLIGRYLAHRTRAAARSAAAELAALEVQMAVRIGPDGAREQVVLDALRAGDLLAVAPGGRIPADGVVVTGSSEIDPQMLTGETMPEAVGPGAQLRAGMLNLSGPLTMRAETLGEETLLRQIARLVEAAEASRNRYANLASRASWYYSHIVNILALAALLMWGLLGGDWRMAINIAAAVLIITCPCALGLAVPAVLTAASGRLFKLGVLLKDGTALERLAEIDHVVFDKTGTLTTGRPVLSNAQTLSDEHMALAMALAEGSAHPLSQAIALAAQQRGIAPVRLSDIAEHPGFGTLGLLGGQEARLGRAEWVGADGDGGARTTAWLRLGQNPAIELVFEDDARADAADTVARLRAAGLGVSLLSGDAEGPVARMADRLGIKTWVARATPAGKVEYLQSLAASGHKVLMVGDGLNDTAALASAHVSISPASAVDASRSAADMILTGGRLGRVVDSWNLARRARRRVLENFAMAFGYNIITVPIAFAGYVTPLIAAIAMSGSSIVVSLNAMRLGRRVK